MPHVTLPQATIDYRELGPADSTYPPVVFVHGIMVDERLWTAVAQPLADNGFRCVLPRLPLGSHTTPVTDRSVLSPRGVAGLIDEFITSLDLTDVTLVGNDTGGGLCQFLLDAHPERIGRVVLTNCDAFDTFPPFPFNAVFALLRGPASIRALTSLLRPAAVRHSALGYGLLARHLDASVTASWIKPARTDRRIAADLAALLRNVANTDLTEVAPRLRRFAKPVNVVWGADDRCFTVSLGKRLTAAFPEGSFTLVSGSRTFVPVDNPTSVVAAIRRLNDVAV